MKKNRNATEGKEKNRKRAVKGMTKIRHTPEGRVQNKKRANKGMKTLRRNTYYAKKEHLHRRKQRFGHSLSEAKDKFKEAISSGSSYVCSCCHQTWFKRSVRTISSLGKTILNTSLLNKCLTGYLSVANCEWLCNTCLFNINKGKIPRLAVINGMKFPYKPAELNLSDLEERLISLRIPFMQIRALNSGGQFSLKGSVVNVPADIEPTIRALPRLRKKIRNDSS